jgi:orotate phosphoribosyltransferase
MDETTKALIEKIIIKYPTPTIIPSGHTSNIYYDCAKLSPNDLARLAAEAIGDLDSDAFDVALGIAYAGICFAAAIAGGRQIAILQTDQVVNGPDLKGQKVVIVDDVVHSGRRLQNAESIATSLGATVVGWACIIDRSEGKVGTAQKPLWSAYQTSMNS